MADKAVDLLLLHPPSVYDFRQKSILYGPVSDMVPSSVMFEIYPIGFLTIAGYLERQGLRVRIVNLALRMLTDPAFDVRAFLAAQRPAAIGIDLHWMPHCHGAIEIARLAKEAHPEVPVLCGGLSATYYHEELLREYPEIDFVLRGDSTEPPLHQLLLALRDGSPLEDIPNLAWRDGGEVRVNPLSYVPRSLDYIDVQPELLIEMALRYRDVTGVLPFNGWLGNPTTMVLPLKGCAFECITCGSSNTTCAMLTGRRKPVFRSPASLAANVAAISRFSRGPIVMPGDLLQGGRKYAEACIDEMAAAGAENEICFEFFDVPPVDFLRYIDARLPSWSFEISPESHDRRVRHAMEGQAGYENDAMEDMLRAALQLNCHRIDVFFMIGLPYQDHRSVMETVDYCGRLFSWGDRRLQCFISPMGPFLDPGSQIFEDPARFGYRKLAHTVAEHRALLEQPSWEHILNYETEWMTRAELVDATYDAAERLNELKREHGYLAPRQAEAVARGIAEARRLRARLRDRQDGLMDPAAAAQLHGEISRFSNSTVCDKRELFWQRHLLNFRLPAIGRVALQQLRR